MKLLENDALIEIVDCRARKTSDLHMNELRLPLLVNYSDYCKGTTYHSEIHGKILHRWTGISRATVHLISIPTISSNCYKCSEKGSVLLSPECKFLCDECANKERLMRALKRC